MVLEKDEDQLHGTCDKGWNVTKNRVDNKCST